MDNKRRLFRLIEVYLNGFKGDLVESIYGDRSRIKVHTVTFGVSDNSVLVELVVVLRVGTARIRRACKRFAVIETH